MVITGEVITVGAQVGVAYLTIRSPEVGTVKVRLTKDDLGLLAEQSVAALRRWMDTAQIDGIESPEGRTQ